MPTDDEVVIPVVTDTHQWQEYNAHGNTCHHPGCALSEDQHAPAAHEITGLGDPHRTFLRGDGTTYTEPWDVEPIHKPELVGRDRLGYGRCVVDGELWPCGAVRQYPGNGGQ